MQSPIGQGINQVRALAVVHLALDHRGIVASNHERGDDMLGVFQRDAKRDGGFAGAEPGIVRHRNRR